MREEQNKNISKKIEEISGLCEELFYLIPLDEDGGKKVRRYIDTIADEIRDTIYREMNVQVE